jgi:hypothetical protein
MSEMISGIFFESLERTSIPVTIGDKTYTLTEASGDTAALYKNRLFANTELGAEGKPKHVRNIADLDAYLVSRCLTDENRLAVSEKTVRSWPNRIVEQLAEKAREISGMDTKDESKNSARDGEAKNEFEQTTDGSD